MQETSRIKRNHKGLSKSLHEIIIILFLNKNGFVFFYINIKKKREKKKKKKKQGYTTNEINEAEESKH